MGTLEVRSELVRQVLGEKVDVGLNAGRTPVWRVPVPTALPRRKSPGRFEPSSFSAFRKKSTRKHKTSLRQHRYNNSNKHYYFYYPAIQPNTHIPSRNQNNHPHGQISEPFKTRKDFIGQKVAAAAAAVGKQRKMDNRQRLEPRDVQITMTVPSATLRPILSSLPLSIRQSDSDTVSGATSPVSGVEIVALGVKETDSTNTTVVLTLRDHHQLNEEDEDEEEEEVEEEEEGVERLVDDLQGILSRPKRSYSRRRMSYGMNGRIRAQMLAHRLSISYRHVQPCSYKDRYYCMNGGTCVFVGALDIKTCR